MSKKLLRRPRHQLADSVIHAGLLGSLGNNPAQRRLLTLQLLRVYLRRDRWRAGLESAVVSLLAIVEQSRAFGVMTLWEKLDQP